MKLSIDIKKIRSFFEKLFFSFAENVFLSCLALFLLALIIGSVMLYKTVFSLGLKESNGADQLKLETEKYENILKVWEKEEKKNKEADSKEYKKLFHSLPKPAEEEEQVD